MFFLGMPIIKRGTNIIILQLNKCLLQWMFFFYKDTMCFSSKPKIQVKYQKEIQTHDFQYMNLDSRSEDL